MYQDGVEDKQYQNFKGLVMHNVPLGKFITVKAVAPDLDANIAKG